MLTWVGCPVVYTQCNGFDSEALHSHHNTASEKRGRGRVPHVSTQCLTCNGPQITNSANESEMDGVKVSPMETAPLLSPQQHSAVYEATSDKVSGHDSKGDENHHELYDDIQRFHSRKFWFAMSLLCISSIFVVIHDIGDRFLDWAYFNCWIFGLYVTGNVGSRVAFEVAEAEGLIVDEDNMRQIGGDFHISRKLSFAIAIVVLASAFVIAGLAPFTDWATAMKWVYGLYVSGNVGAKWANWVETLLQRPAPHATRPSLQN